MVTKTKYHFAKVIGAGYSYNDNPTYENLLEVIHNNYYRAIGKCPIDIFIEGSINTIVIKDINHANKLLELLKEVVQEALEYNGIELTCQDNDWADLRLLENESRYGGKYILPKLNKSYMSEFFEFY